MSTRRQRDDGRARSQVRLVSALPSGHGQRSQSNVSRGPGTDHRHNTRPAPQDHSQDRDHIERLIRTLTTNPTPETLANIKTLQQAYEIQFEQTSHPPNTNRDRLVDLVYLVDHWEEFDNPELRRLARAKIKSLRSDEARFVAEVWGLQYRAEVLSKLIQSRNQPRFFAAYMEHFIAFRGMDQLHQPDPARDSITMTRRARVPRPATQVPEPDLLSDLWALLT